MADKSGLELCGTDVQLPAITLPQRLWADGEDAADFRLRNGLTGKYLDQTTLHVRGVMPGSAGGLIREFHP
ncbi:hypothetical protein [Rhizobium ecuadorense]|uniref:hypothetical protein n=1 Tax=Rhizobium ecuadorense TaxID=1671795 RepID=UPI0006733BEE